MSYFSVIPVDLLGLTISNMTLDAIIRLIFSDPSILNRLENNPFMLNKFQIDLTSNDQKKKFRKLLCNLGNNVTDKFLLSAIELNSAPLVEYGLRQGYTKFSAFDGSEIGKTNNPDIINLMINHYISLGDPEKTRILEGGIAVGAARAGNIDLSSKYLSRGITRPDELFANVMLGFTKNRRVSKEQQNNQPKFITLSYLNEKYDISSNIILRGLDQIYGDGGADDYDLFDWVISNPKIYSKIYNEFKPNTYLSGLLFQRTAALGTLEDVAEFIRRGADDFPMALNGAAHHGRLDIILYLLGNYRDKFEERNISRALDWAMNSTLASEENQIEIIKILLANGGQVKGLVLSVTIGKGLSKIVEFVLPYKTGDYMFEMINAIASRDLQLIDLVYQDAIRKNYSFQPHLINMLYSGAIGSERIDILDWVIEKFGIPENKEIMMRYAISTCNQEVIDYFTALYTGFEQSGND